MANARNVKIILRRSSDKKYQYDPEISTQENPIVIGLCKTFSANQVPEKECACEAECNHSVSHHLITLPYTKYKHPCQQCLTDDDLTYEIGLKMRPFQCKEC